MGKSKILQGFSFFCNMINFSITISVPWDNVLYKQLPKATLTGPCRTDIIPEQPTIPCQCHLLLPCPQIVRLMGQHAGVICRCWRQSRMELSDARWWADLQGHTKQTHLCVFSLSFVLLCFFDKLFQDYTQHLKSSALFIISSNLRHNRTRLGWRSELYYGKHTQADERDGNEKEAPLEWVLNSWKTVSLFVNKIKPLRVNYFVQFNY